MVASVTGTSLLSTVNTSNAAPSGASQIATLQAQIEAKQKELDDAKTADDKDKYTLELAELKAKLLAAELAETKKAEARQQGTTAAQDDKTTPVATLIGTRNFDDGQGFGTREMWV